MRTEDLRLIESGMEALKRCREVHIIRREWAVDEVGSLLTL